MKRLYITFLAVTIVTISSTAQIAHWRLNNNATDDSGSGIHGTLVGSPVFITTDIKEGTHALTFDGNDQYVSLGNPSNLPSGLSPRSISVWAKTTTTSGDHIIVAYGLNSTSRAMYVGQSGSSLIAGGFGNNITVSNFWSANVWRHITLTYDGSTARLYADGQEVASSPRTWDLILSRAAIGRHVNNSHYWSGAIDDVRIYNTALSLGEIEALAMPVPSAPSALTTTGSSGNITLTWADNSPDETAFEIERSLNPGNGYVLIHTTAANVVSYVDESVTENTTYYYRVRSNNANGSSDYSNESNAVATGEMPAAPTGLQALAASSTSIELNWTDNSADETGFQIERSTSEEGSYSLIATTLENADTYLDEELTSGSTYYYRIRSINTSGYSEYTPIVSVTTLTTGGIVGLWSLDNNAFDGSGNGHDGILMNDPVFSTDYKKGTHALTFNGVDQYISLGTPSHFPSGQSPRSISVWAKTTTLSGDHIIVAYGKNANSQAMFIGQVGSTLFTGGYSNNLTVPNFWSVNVWRHICLTYDGSTARIYADGVEIASEAKTWNLVVSRAAIGRHVTNTQYWNGAIDDVRIYDKALSLAEVQELATSAPVPPSGLTATVVSAQQVDLTWTDNSSDETGFEIERSLSPGTGYSLVHTTTANVTTYADEGLTSSTFYYRIRSKNGGNFSAYSNEVSASTAAIPAVATAFTVVSESATSVKLSWTDNANSETGYQIERSLIADGEFVIIHTTAANVVEYSNTGLTTGTTYYYRIRAANTVAATHSAYTPVMSGAPQAVPGAPLNLHLVSRTTSSIQLAWTDNSTNETGFELERSFPYPESYELIATLPPNATSYTDSELESGTFYNYRLRAINGTGTSTSITLSYSSTLPVIPAALTAEITSPTKVKLTWTGNPPDGYVFVQRSLNPTNGFVSLFEQGLAETEVTVHGNKPGSTYYYRIAATLDNLEDFQFSEPVSVTMPVFDQGLVPDSVETAILAIISYQINAYDGFGWPNPYENEYEQQWPSILSSSKLGGLQGVTVQNNDIVGLDIGAADLSDLPDEIAQLAELRTLDLSDGYYRAYLRVHLPKIEELNVSNDATGGDLSIIQQLTTLKILKMANCQYSYLKTLDVSNLTNLRYLDASNNDLQSITGLSGLAELEYMNLRGNELREIDGVDNLLSLNTVRLEGNYLDFGDLEPFFLNNPDIPDFTAGTPNMNRRTPVMVNTPTYTFVNNYAGGSFTRYQWQKGEENEFEEIEWNDLSGDTLQDLTVSVDESMVNNHYRCKMTNDLVADVTLYSKAYTIADLVSGSNVLWNDLKQAEWILDNLVISTAGTASATSSNILTANQDGWIQFVFYYPGSDQLKLNPSPRPTFSIGLTTLSSAYANSPCDYSFELVGHSYNNFLVVAESGEEKSYLDPLEEGMVFKIVREGSMIKYYVNGDLVYDSPTSSNEELIVQVSSNAYIVPIISSFGSPSRTFYTVNSGTWTDPNVWSLTEGGTPGTYYPGNLDQAFIKGHDVTISSGIFNSGVNVIVTNENTALKIEGDGASLNVKGLIKINGNPQTNPVKSLIVRNKGKIEVKAP